MLTYIINSQDKDTKEPPVAAVLSEIGVHDLKGFCYVSGRRYRNDGEIKWALNKHYHTPQHLSVP
jgi:hypothetical protein